MLFSINYRVHLHIHTVLVSITSTYCTLLLYNLPLPIYCTLLHYYNLPSLPSPYSGTLHPSLPPSTLLATLFFSPCHSTPYSSFYYPTLASNSTILLHFSPHSPFRVCSPALLLSSSAEQQSPPPRTYRQ
jgi:hypothetical protein